MDGWMRVRDLARVRVADSQNVYSGVIAKTERNSSLYNLRFDTDTVALDFEEHLKHGLGVVKNAAVALKFRLWLYIVKRKRPHVVQKRCNMFYNCCNIISKIDIPIKIKRSSGLIHLKKKYILNCVLLLTAFIV